MMDNQICKTSDNIRWPLKKITSTYAAINKQDTPVCLTKTLNLNTTYKNIFVVIQYQFGTRTDISPTDIDYTICGNPSPLDYKYIIDGDTLTYSFPIYNFNNDTYSWHCYSNYDEYYNLNCSVYEL